MEQATASQRWGSLFLRWFGVVLVAGVAVMLAATQARWLPAVRGWVSPPRGDSSHDDRAHDEEHAAHEDEDADSIQLSSQARKNIGLTIGKVELQTFTRTISLPGIVIERPGRSTVEVTTPMTGIVTRIYPIQGQSVGPGEKLFDLRLTHEEIVQAQTELLRSAEELDVLAREIQRLEKVSADGAIAGKTLLERKYEQQKLQAISRAQEQALLLHGLSQEQVDSILAKRSLLQQLTIDAPGSLMTESTMPAPYQVQHLKVSPGQHVEAGAALATLTNYAELFIEGSAFERDAGAINQAIANSWPVTAVMEGDAPARTIEDLKILYLAGKVESDTRALHFYVTLPNIVEHQSTIEDERTFVNWRHRPGQRVQLLVPVETLPERIVVPTSALAIDGAETYVFVRVGKRFVRRPVHVEFRDSLTAIIANDGSIAVGDNIATTAAQQLQLALENKAGGGIDPHAGHTH